MLTYTWPIEAHPPVRELRVVRDKAAELPKRSSFVRFIHSKRDAGIVTEMQGRIAGARERFQVRDLLVPLIRDFKFSRGCRLKMGYIPRSWLQTH